LSPKILRTVTRILCCETPLCVHQSSYYDDNVCKVSDLDRQCILDSGFSFTMDPITASIDVELA
jgi:hypothetical protein